MCVCVCVCGGGGGLEVGRGVGSRGVIRMNMMGA